jgi:hypothetical protein
MKKLFTVAFSLILLSPPLFCQLYMTRTGFVGFYSKAPLEDIHAENNQVYAIIDAAKKNIAFTLLIKGFIFEKELMQTHFNENYLESDKYPKASFSGSFTTDFPLNSDGTYKILLKGTLSLHNITKIIELPASLTVSAGRILGTAQFIIKPEDYQISIPSIVRDKIARELTVTVKADCSIIH